MAVVVTNSGEREWLRTMLSTQAITVGLYKHQVSPDGNLSYSHLTGLTEIGGYAPKELANSLSNVRTADRWHIYTETGGRARADYSNAPIVWTFTEDNVSLNEEAYGIYAWTHVLGFNNGSIAINVGDTITGETSNATAVVTSVRLLSGSWANNNAVGQLCVKTVNGTFQANENLKVGVATVAKATGDVVRELLFVDTFTTPQAIDTVGQRIEVTLTLFLSTY